MAYSIKELGIFINQDLFFEQEVELRKEVQKVKSRKEKKWEIIRNQRVIIRDRDQKDNNKLEFGTLRTLSWNCRGFPWSKGLILSWISSEIDIIFLVETWEHEESKVANMECFLLWLAWNI